MSPKHPLNQGALRHAAGGSLRALHQHHAISALDQERFKPRPEDEYKNPIKQRFYEDYLLNNHSIEGAEQLKYYGRLNRVTLRQKNIADAYKSNYLDPDQLNEA